MNMFANLMLALLVGCMVPLLTVAAWEEWCSRKAPRDARELDL